MQDKLKYYQSKLSIADFIKISEFVQKNYGIRLSDKKKVMVQNRLYKRLIATEIDSFFDYTKYVFSPSGKTEVPLMIDEITTNKTDFFRENGHFVFFEKVVLKQLDNLKVWSAGCSSGEEVYTIAMILNENSKKYSILGTDLSSKVVKKAKEAVYDKYKTKDIPPHLLKKYFDEIKVKEKILHSAKDIIRKNTEFRRLNFLDSNYNIPQKLDIVFFRNVLIYFNHKTQGEILDRIIKHLKVGGYIFIGHSEAIYDFSLPLKGVNPSVYQKI